MLEQAVQGILKKTMEENYSHLVLPSAVYAAVTGARELAQTYEAGSVTFHGEEPGTSRTGTVTAHWREYTLRILDSSGNPDESYPLIPGVRSKLYIETGAIVAAVLLGGGISPALIGEVVL